MTIEYRIKSVERFIITRHETFEPEGEAQNCKASQTRQIGNEFASSDTAYEVGYALARQEAEMKGYGPGDMHLIYPSRVDDAVSSGAQLAT